VEALSGDQTPVIRPEGLRPSGQKYKATVPDTLDLAERARLSVHGLTSFLNAQADYAPYGHAYFNANPPYMSDLPGGPPNWGKIAEALVFARLMCGSEENLQIDARMFEGMLASPWMQVNPVAPTPVSCGMQALMAVYQLDPHPSLIRKIDDMAEAHLEAAKFRDGAAYYYDGPYDERETSLGVLGYWLPVFIQGRAIRSLTRWGALDGDPKYVELSGKLAKFLLEPKYWVAEAGPKVVHGANHGHFNGHHHSYTQALIGLLWYAEVTHDRPLKQFVRASYEYLRNFGIAGIGLFGEGCTTGDMVLLAIKLSDSGVGDYWDDADRYVRNHLAELQITDAARLCETVETMPEGRGKNDTTQGPFDLINESQDNVIERNVGVFLSDATHPTLIPEPCLLYTICCTGNCTAAMYAAWESTVRCHDGVAQVNLLLNRASPWLDIESYLPHEGKVVIRNKAARRLCVRLPGWVQHADCRLNGQAADVFWAGRYLVLEALEPKDVVTIMFALPETIERYTLKWKQSEFWKESTNPGPSWQPDRKPTEYVCRFRGNTLVEIGPRDQGPGYPLYLRDHLKSDRAPLTKVVRYVPSRLLAW
jgi:hypothetical protein